MKNLDKLGHINIKGLCLSKDLIIRPQVEILATSVSNKDLYIKHTCTHTRTKN